MIKMESARRHWSQWFWPLGLAATIVWASSRSQVAAPGISHFDKFAHFAVFGLLATLIGRMGRGWSSAVLAVFAISAFGGIDEWHQSFTPGRSVEFEDWMADTLGASLAVILYWGWPCYRRVLELSLFPRKPRIENSAAVQTIP